MAEPGRSVWSVSYAWINSARSGIGSPLRLVFDTAARHS